jgi:hypothetical protein
MSAKHSIIVRGLSRFNRERNRESAPGRFGRFFPGLPAADFGKTPEQATATLKPLADAMVSPFEPPKDAPDSEESGIPSLYTYFGQFIDHDLTFDPDGSLQKQKDPDATRDFRTAAFDLDNLYGRGPGDQPYLYDSDGRSLLLGDPITQGKPPGALDLQRNAHGRALIGDPRNDENAIVSQLQGLFLRFHNRMVRDHPNRSFEQIQQRVRHHYQYVVVNDFLSRIVSRPVLDALKSSGRYDRAKLKLFREFDEPFMPVEFSVAAYRLGHSMIRPGYRLNDVVLLPIFPLPADQTTGNAPLPEGLTGFRRLIPNWGLDWGRFIDIDQRAYGSASDQPSAREKLDNFSRLQFAYRIDTALVDPLKNLPAAVADNPPPSLALRNLVRGWQFGLPTGQAVAAALEVPVLADKDILIGQGVDKPDAPLPSIASIGGGAYKDKCPLWTYILAEAMLNKTDLPVPVTQSGGAPRTISTPQLGPVGGRIVAEVFLGLLFADRDSYLALDPNFKPDGKADYALRDFVRFALGL